ncbi:hypothetical protein Btru_005742, partial [Bulinus truncatus]
MIVTGNGYGLREKEDAWISTVIKFRFHNFSDGLICLPVDSPAENGTSCCGTPGDHYRVTTNSITCIPLNIAQVIETDWIFSNLTCQLMTFFAQFGISASSLTLCCMACERYIAIVHPLKFGSLQTISRAIVVLIMVWILALASGAPYLYYSKVRQPPCFDRRKCKEAPVGVVMISVTGLRNRYKKKAVKMLLLVVLLFLLCWTPILIFDIVKLQHSFTFDGVVNLKYYLQ